MPLRESRARQVVFRRETFDVAKEHGVMGARREHRRRFASPWAGDSFVAFVCVLGILNGQGLLTSIPFEAESKTFGPVVPYPNRCKDAFVLTGAALPEGDLVWGLDQWKRSGTRLRTYPATMLFCDGEFLESQPSDFDFLVPAVDARSSPAGPSFGGNGNVGTDVK